VNSTSISAKVPWLRASYV